MFWMRAYPLHGEVGGGWGPGILKFFGPKETYYVPQYVGFFE